MNNRLSTNMQLIFPRGFSANFVVLMWSLCGGILLYSLLANFRVMLLKPMLEKPVNTAKDILDRGMVPMTKDRAQFHVDLLRQSSNPIYQKLADRAIVPKDSDELLRFLEDYVLGAGTHVYLMISDNDDLYELGDFHYSKDVLEGYSPWAVWIVNKKWSLHDQLAIHILIYQQVRKTLHIIK